MLDEGVSVPYKSLKVPYARGIIDHTLNSLEEEIETIKKIYSHIHIKAKYTVNSVYIITSSLFTGIL